MLGRLAMGVLADKFNPWMLALSTLGSTALAIFVLWGVLSTTFTGLLGFSVAYGVLASGWSSLWAAFIKPIASASGSAHF